MTGITALPPNATNNPVLNHLNSGFLNLRETATHICIIKKISERIFNSNKKE